jgi:cytochrome c-type biogenesis protein CcmH
MSGRLRSLGATGAALLAVAALAACDRKLEPFDPAEEPRQPDLSKIFPEGAEAAPIAPEGGSIELPPPPVAERGAPPLAAESGQPIQGTLRLAAELENARPAGAVVFLIARTAAAGPPLAVKRIEAPRFPLEFEIGPADRMLATMPFAGTIQLSARLDSDGNATSRTPGDLMGVAPQAVSPGASGVEIVLDQKL